MIQRLTGLVNKSYVLKLAAYLIREAANLDDNDPVVLNIGAESVRELALLARDERDLLREMASEKRQARSVRESTFIRRAREIVFRFGVCSMADEDEDKCSYTPCPYCELVCLVEEEDARQ